MLALVMAQVIGTDGGFLQRPVTVRKLRLGVAERFTLIADFAGQEGRNIRVMNVPEKDQDSQSMFCYSHYIMEFRVGSTVTSTEGNQVPDPLRADTPLADLGLDESVIANTLANGVHRTFDFGRSGGQWTINGLTWEDEANRVIAHPQVNSFEIWKLQNNQ
mgnify:FL=1